MFTFIIAFWLESVLSFVLHLYFWNYEEGKVIEESARIRSQVGGVNMIVLGGITIHFIAETFRLQQQQEEKEKLSIESDLKLKEMLRL